MLISIDSSTGVISVSSCNNSSFEQPMKLGLKLFVLLCSQEPWSIYLSKKLPLQPKCLPEHYLLQSPCILLCTLTNPFQILSLFLMLHRLIRSCPLRGYKTSTCKKSATLPLEYTNHYLLFYKKEFFTQYFCQFQFSKVNKSLLVCNMLL
jgi:hypothetical protein